MLVTKILSTSHNVFKSCISQGHLNMGFFGKSINGPRKAGQLEHTSANRQISQQANQLVSNIVYFTYKSTSNGKKIPKKENGKKSNKGNKVNRQKSPQTSIIIYPCPLNPFPNKPWILSVSSKCLLKTLLEQKKLLVTSNFFFSHSVFYPFREPSALFIKFKIVVCKLSPF